MTNDPYAPRPEQPAHLTEVSPPVVGSAPPAAESLPPMFPSSEPTGSPQANADAVVRPWLNLAWDGVLLLAVAAAIAALILLPGSPAVFGSFGEAGTVLIGYVPLLLLAMAVAVSLRSGNINLAVVHQAGLAAVLYAAFLPEGELIAWLAAIGGALAAGVVIALAVTLLRAPAWAVSLLVTVAILAGFDMRWNITELPSLELAPLFVWLVIGAVIVASLAGGAIGFIRPVRNLLARTSQAVESTGSATGGTVATVWGTLLLSSLLAGLAGVLVLLPDGMELTPMVTIGQGILYMILAVGIALLGGTSARGGRGGVAGTVLATSLFVAVSLLSADSEPAVRMWWLPLGTMVVGLIVSRVIGGGRRSIAAGPAASEAAPVTAEEPDSAPDPAQVSMFEPVAPQMPADSSPDSQSTVQLPAQGQADPYSVQPAADVTEEQYWPPAPAEPAVDRSASSTSEPPASPGSAAAESAPPEAPQPDRSSSTEVPPDNYQYRPPTQ